jgi:mycothiol system anti-sigma-R factor
MSDCRKLEPLITPYVDGELGEAERATVSAHVDACPPCCRRMEAERSVRSLLQARREALRRDRAPASLRARCVAQGAAAPAATPWRERLVPFAIAASLVLLAGMAFVYQATEWSPRLMAAELTADHVKCFAMNAVLGTHETPVAVERDLATRFGWHLNLPDTTHLDLRLVGARPCLYGEGRVAHVMFRHGGRPVSVFMLPRSTRPPEVLEVFGHEAAIWSSGGRTFVLIASEPRPEVERIASVIQASFR